MDQNKKILIGSIIFISILVLIAWVLNNNISNLGKAMENNQQIPPATSESPTFLNTIWIANSIEEKNLIENSSISIQFDDQGKLTGNDGCNTFNGTYEENGSNIKIDPNLISTKKACSEEIMNQADAFTKLLISSTSYKLGDGVMILIQGNSEGLKFIGATNSLSKTSWNVTGYNNGKEAIVGPIINTNPTMIFGDDGTISGNASCNSYSGKYNLSGNKINIENVVATRRECIEPEGIMEQESSFLSYLQKANTWLIQGNQLYLRTAEDQLAVTAINNSETSN